MRYCFGLYNDEELSAALSEALTRRSREPDWARAVLDEWKRRFYREYFKHWHVNQVHNWKYWEMVKREEQERKEKAWS